MWPFSEKEPERDYVGEGVAELKAFRKSGERFNYLGATVLVSRVGADYMGCGVWRAVLEGNYRDNEGRIRTLYFYPRDLPAMRAENT